MSEDRGDAGPGYVGILRRSGLAEEALRLATGGKGLYCIAAV